MKVDEPYLVTLLSCAKVEASITDKIREVACV
jgi:hypothetical protein